MYIHMYTNTFMCIYKYLNVYTFIFIYDLFYTYKLHIFLEYIHVCVLFIHAYKYTQYTHICCESWIQLIVINRFDFLTYVEH